MPKKNVTWDYISIFVPILRAYGTVDTPASAGYGLLPTDQDTGNYQMLESAPQLNDNVAGYLEIQCMALQFFDESGNIVRQDLMDENPLSDGMVVSATFAEDILLSPEQLQAQKQFNAQEILMTMATENCKNVVLLLVPMRQANGGSAMGISALFPPEKISVVPAPEAVAAAIAAESTTDEDDPNNMDQLFPDVDDGGDDDKGPQKSAAKPKGKRGKPKPKKGTAKPKTKKGTPKKT